MKDNTMKQIIITVLCLVCSVLSVQAEKPDYSEDKLEGTVIGTDRWTGLDLGTPHVITRVGWTPRNADVGERGVILGLFEGSNREDFVDAIPLYMITEMGTVSIMSFADVNVSRGFRYVRWCAPAEGQSDNVFVEFFGQEGEGDDSHFYQLSNLPTLSYHTYAGIEPYDKVHELESEMCLIYDDGTRIQEYPVLARERGNGSRYELFKKRPYRIKFNDGKSHHMLKDSPLQSPAKSKKWVLMPNWREKTMIRNNIAFEMSRRLGLRYTPWIQNVDVIVNGEYKGNYQLADQVTVDPNRVDIAEMLPEDNEEYSITGGYLLEITGPGDEQYHFSSNIGGIPVDVKYPDDKDITSEQFSYIRNAFNEMESLLWSSNYTHPDKGYRSKLDLESFLRFFLVGEFAGNHDAMWSLYLYKDRDDDLFHFGPVWDFDLSMDNDQRSYPANGKPYWLYNYGSAVTGIRDFVSRILSDPDAYDTLSAIWADMRESGAFTPESMCAFVDSLGQVMDESQRLNFTRWDNLGVKLTLQQFAPGTYQGELDIVKNYLQGRIRWIDKKLGYGQIPQDVEFVIATPEDLKDFAEMVNNGDNSRNAVVTADLDFKGYKITSIGNSNYPYMGRFDGGGHTFSNVKIETNSSYTGIFSIVGGGAVIKNFVLDNSCSISGKSYVGIIGGSNGGGTITMECLGNEGSVTASDRNAGAIFGCNMSAAATPIFINCYVTGPVTGHRESGQITGYAGNGQAYNCYGSGSIVGYYYKDMSDAMLRGNPKSTNCFSTTPDKNATEITPEQVASGELCYLLNEYSGQDTPVWFQTIGKDDHPVLDPTHGIVLLADDGTFFNEDTDGIASINNEQLTMNNGSAVYDLSGRKMFNVQCSTFNGLKKGIYIVNGKKILVK